MSRETDGWEYVGGQPRWAPTVAVCMANILGGLYGEEYDALREELEDLVRAAQRDAAEKILFAGRHHPDPRGPYRTAVQMGDYFAGLIFPDYPDNSDNETE
jgi:hypothetical protein